MQSITEIVNVTREVSWLPWAVQYFFLIGLSIGCFLLTLPWHLARRARWEGVARLALAGALTCGLAAPVALLADLHQPARFWRFYAHPNLGSWMAWGAFFIPAYLVGLFAYSRAVLRPELAEDAAARGRLAPLYRLMGGRPSRRLVRATAGLTGIGAALVLLYTGMEVAVVAARPLWNTPFLPVQFALTALAGAAGLVLVLQRLIGPRAAEAEAALNGVVAMALGASLAVGLAWLLLGLSGLSAVHAEALASVSGHRRWLLTAIWGVAATLAAVLIALARPVGSGLVTGLVALHAAWMFRWTVFIGGQTVPKTGAGLYEYTLPLGPAGLAGIIGTAGLCVTILVVIDALLPPARGPGSTTATAERI